MNQKPNTDIVMYTTDDGLTKIEATFNEDTVWLSLVLESGRFSQIRFIGNRLFKFIKKPLHILDKSFTLVLDIPIH